MNSDCKWKPNWQQSQQRFTDWWNHSGLVLGIGEVNPVRLPDHQQHAQVTHPGPPLHWEQRHTDPNWIAQYYRYHLAGYNYPADTLPFAFPDIGCASLCVYLGVEPEFSEDTIWYSPCIHDPENHPALIFDPQQKWWRNHEAIYRAVVNLAHGDYLVGMPGIGSNVEVLAALRGTQSLMTDLLDRPGWVKQKLDEINTAFFAAFDRLYEIVKLSDGSASGSYFGLWGPGKTSLITLDPIVMFSRRMFDEFVLPPLRQQCAWLEHSMLHVDGQGALRHVDALLEIDDLDALEFTPDPVQTKYGMRNPGGGPEFYDLYRRILKAGKSIQVMDVWPEEVLPLLDAVGSQGVYLLVVSSGQNETEDLLKRVEPYGYHD
jgi:hypothetical protein